LLFVNLVMDSLGAIMLGNEPALEKYMTEKPRRRDESIVSKSMALQIGIMAIWMTLVSFCFLKLPVFRDLYGTEEKLRTAFFVLFVVAALFNGFNVRDNGFGIFKGLKDNPGFLKVWFTIVLVQALIVNAALIPLDVFKWIGSMFSCTPFGWQGWVVVFVLAFTMIPVDLLRKALMGTRRENRGGVKEWQSA
uniref:cation transporting ATPase C-terminal domain-containing protein n=1 Tax=Eubacterium cellulosolvens TaxID=29322 RepID=UPI000555D54F